MAAGVSSFLAALALAVAGASGKATLRADDIPVAHTPRVPADMAGPSPSRS